MAIPNHPSLPTLDDDERFPRFMSMNIPQWTGIKTLDAIWASCPMVRQVAEGLKVVHDREFEGCGWIPGNIYGRSVSAALNSAQAGSKMAENTYQATKKVSRKVVPKAIQNTIGSAWEVAKCKADLIDNYGVKTLDSLRENVPIVGETSEGAKAKAIRDARKLSAKIVECISAFWISQKTLGVLDVTLTVTEKPLAFIGNVQLVEEDTSSSKRKVHFQIDEKPKHYSLDLYTYGLHGKFVESARYILKKVRGTRQVIRKTKNVGKRVIAKKTRRSQRRKVVPRKRISSISDVGTLGYAASTLGVDKIVSFFGLRIIPADGIKARRFLYPNMKLVHKYAPSPSSNDGLDAVVERIRSKRNRQSESEEDSYDEARWINQLQSVDDYDSDTDQDNQRFNTSMDSLEDFEVPSATADSSNDCNANHGETSDIPNDHVEVDSNHNENHD